MICNGQAITLDAPVTLQEFLTAQSYDPTRVAVERNGEVVRRADFDRIQLTDDDTLEIVRFVGGG